MLLICFRIGMTVCTGYLCIVGRITVTIGTLVPFTFVIPAVDRKILGIVIEVSRRPGCLTMATVAVCRKLCSNVIGVGCVVIIICMTTCAGVGGVIIVTVVTLGAIIGDTGMCTVQRVVAVVAGEGCRLPRHIGMTGGTIGGNIEGNVVRIDRLIVIIGMAARTGIRSTGVVTIVAGRTICRYYRVRTRKRIVYVVVKCGGRPGSLGMARCTVSRELLSSVIR